VKRGGSLRKETGCGKNSCIEKKEGEKKGIVLSAGVSAPARGRKDLHSTRGRRDKGPRELSRGKGSFYVWTRGKIYELQKRKLAAENHSRGSDLTARKGRQPKKEKRRSPPNFIEGCLGEKKHESR